METRSFPLEGITRLVIEQASGDARVRATAGAAVVTITYRPAGRQGGGSEFAADGDTLRFTGGAVSRVDLSPDLALTLLDTAGDLWIEDLAAALTLEAVHGDLRLHGVAGPVTVGQVSGDLRADRVAALEIQERCDGDLRAQAVGRLAIATLAGDLRGFELESLRAGAVHGDVWVEKVAGPVEIGQAGGDLHLDDVTGPVRLGRVAGDLRLGGLLAGLDAASVSGDADLREPFPGENAYRLAASGDIALHLPAEADLRLAVSAAGRIRSDVQLTPAADGSATFTAVLGQGSAQVSLESRGDLRIRQEGGRGANEPFAGARVRAQFGAGLSAGLDDLGDRIREQVQASLAAAGLDFESGRYGPERGGRGRGGRHGPRPTGPGFGTPPAPPPPPGPAAERPARPAAAAGGSAPPAGPDPAEQMAVLKMLEEGTITAAEAETLLKALGAG